ncbi:MAG: hypothetical protein Q9172_005449 [Xanthocarpia lactea]
MPFLPSQLTLLTSLIAYPTLLRLLCGPAPNNLRFSKAIKTISTLHSSLVTALALYVLSQPQWHTSPPPQQQSPLSPWDSLKPGSGTYPDDSTNPTITGQSELANSITAIECGYLVQDTVAILLQAGLDARAGGGKSTRLLDKTLLTHHIGIGTALLVLHYYIAHGRERGIYIILQFLLMNASTPVLNLRWYLRTFKPGWKNVRLLTDVSFVVAFFAARVWLVAKILGDYGAWHGWGAWETYWKGLRVPCKVGTGALWIANVGWWSVLVWNVASRSTKLTLGAQ